MLSHDRCILLVGSALWSLLIIGCSQSGKSGPEPKGGQSLSADTRVPRQNGPTDKEYAALHNLMQVTDKIYSGGEPHGEEAFASLARLGVKTVVSVDGTRPDIEAAREYGIRYVHIPIGYDGIEKEAGQSLARLVREADGPIYVHCHHGQHRGPAAAAVACIAAGEVDGKGALKILEKAGTSKDYAGLWRDVEHYQTPPSDAKLPELVEVARVDSLAAAMAKLDRAYDNLKLCRDADWSTPRGHPDLVPAQEALLLKEGFRESGRNLPGDFSAEFKTWLAESESAAQKLEDILKMDNPDGASRQFQALEKSCKQCHSKYRN
jgi:protein tyrosine phosphatase (PTP) superfamily phosphohydrolase (DUF442 family)